MFITGTSVHYLSDGPGFDSLRLVYENDNIELVGVHYRYFSPLFI